MTRTVLGSLALACALVACSDSSTPKDTQRTAGNTARSDQRDASSYGTYYGGISCDYTEEGLAWCDDDYTVVYCSGGTWWAVDCYSIGYDYCTDDGYTVDCY